MLRRALRAGLGEGSEILVATVGGGATERGAWRRSLASARDPWLQLAGSGALAAATEGA